MARIIENLVPENSVESLRSLCCFPIRIIKSFFKNKQKSQVDRGNNAIKNNFEFILPEKKQVYEKNQIFEGVPDVKLLAFFLPQFHVMPENDLWWGKGFTEWTNTRKATPRYDGHYQPRTPNKDIGYYDLSRVETLERQAKMAQEHGIYGFCFYYYWFSGKTLLDTPINILLSHPDINIPFCLCWANENWTRRWDGQDDEILIKQEYAEQDPIQFINDLKRYFLDDRYIRIDGKPIILVYWPGRIPDIDSVFELWRKKAKELGIGEIMIWACRVFGTSASDINITHLIDGEVQFPPHCLPASGYKKETIRDKNTGEDVGIVNNYSQLVEAIIKENATGQVVPLYKTCMMQWDNSSRRKNGFISFVNYSLTALYKWLVYNIEYTRQHNEHKYMFINAWNEWAEGAYLEPDEEFGYTNINTVSRALYGIPLDEEIKIVSCRDFIETFSERQPEIAVHIHLFYTDLIDEFIGYLKNIPYKYDCYISTDSDLKANKIKSRFIGLVNARKISVETTINQGRDIGPFLQQMSMIALNYDYICHIHTKKSKYSKFGDDWRKHMLTCLLGDEIHVRNIVVNFEVNKNLGLLFPEQLPQVRTAFPCQWHINYDNLLKLLADIGVNIKIYDYDPIFPCGNMFWARTKAVENIFKRNFKCEDFDEEKNQKDGTLAHIIERSWWYIALNNGYKYFTVNYVHDTNDRIDCYRDVRREYIKYKILSKITYGDLRRKYKQKRVELEQVLRNIKSLSVNS
jgi:lipopolysaccharide biosynthesis protein